MSRLNFCGQISSYLGTAAGTVDFFELVNTGAHWFAALPLNLEQIKTVDAVKTLSADGNSLLAWPGVVVEAQKLGARFCEMSDAYALPYADDTRDAQIQSAWNNAFEQGADFISRGCKGTLHLHARQWIDLGKALPYVEGAFHLSWLYSDIVDLSRQIGKAMTEEDFWLPLLNIVKDISSIAMAIIGFVALLFQVMLGIVFLSPPLTVGLSTIYISAKLSSVFYERMVFEPR